MKTLNRELTTRYKQSPPPMGVYLIRNLANDRIFVGASTNVHGAMNRDRFELAQKTHRNARLMQDWLSCGAECFSFEVLDTVRPRDEPGFDDKAELASLWDMWRQELPCFGDKGYNTTRVKAGR